MPRIIRQASTLAVVPPSPDDELPEDAAQTAPSTSSEPTNGHASESEPASRQTQVVAEAKPVRRRGRPPATETAGRVLTTPSPAVTTPPSSPAAAAQALGAHVSPETLQGLGLLYMLCQSLGAPPAQVVELLRSALKAHDELSAQ